jgi:hypothetical protein
MVTYLFHNNTMQRSATQHAFARAQESMGGITKKGNQGDVGVSNKIVGVG